MSLLESAQRFVSELKRRHVIRVACGYGIAGFAVVQVANNFFPPLHLPDWTTTLVAVLVVLGFPIALALAWAFEITPDGVRRTEPGTATVAYVRPRGVAGYVGLGMVITLVSFGGYAAYRGIPGRAGNVSALAVLPFGNLSTDPENEYFSDGMTEDVLGQLANIRQIRLIPRTSVMQYKRTSKPITQIAQELGVTHVLEGSIRRYGNQVRISAKLIDARNNEVLWSDNFDRSVSDILAVQSEIAREITRKLNARLTTSDRDRLAASRNRTINPEAYEAYLRGIYHSDEGRQAEAIKAFQMAVSVDPAFASAYVGIARNAFFLGFYGLESPRTAFATMREAAQRALDLDESLADAHAALALYQAHYERNWAEAEAGFKRALELNPNNAQVHHDYAHLLLALGRRADSARESDKAAQLDPTNSMLTACAGWHGFTNGEYDDAVIRSLKALMMMPNMFWPEMVLGWAYEQTGKTNEAIAAFRKASAHSGASSFSLASLGHALAAAQRINEARDVLRDLEARTQTQYVSPYDLAVLYASLNQTDAALKSLEAARVERSGFLAHAGWDPRLASLHKDARFDAFLKSLGLPRQPIQTPKPATSAGMSMGMPASDPHAAMNMAPSPPVKITPAIRAALAKVRTATVAFRDIDAARRAGYTAWSPDPFAANATCSKSPTGAMGYHLVNAGLRGSPANPAAGDAAIDEMKPEMLLYEKTAEGKLQLAGVEYLVFTAAWERVHGVGAAPAQAFGQPLLASAHSFVPDGPIVPHYELHVWLHSNNPLGVFDPWNSAVRC